MKCPFCSTPETKVVESRINQTNDSIRRRRECLECQGRFTTYERVEEIFPAVIKKDGRREPYLREKISSGVQRACQKRSISLSRIDELVSSVEKRVLALGFKEVPSGTIGNLVMQELQRLDKIAYVRFASVYREFRDVQEFVAELRGSLGSETEAP